MQKVAATFSPVIPIDRAAARPLHKQIYDAYRRRIAEGGLRPGQRVPSTRVLCRELGISRMPVLEAYSQLLAEGYLEKEKPTDFQIRKKVTFEELIEEWQRLSATVRIEQDSRDDCKVGWHSTGCCQRQPRAWSDLSERHCQGRNARAIQRASLTGSRQELTIGRRSASPVSVTPFEPNGA